MRRLWALVVAVAFVTLAGPVNAVEMQYNFNEGGSNNAINILNPGSKNLTPTNYDGTGISPRVASGAGVSTPGDAANFGYTTSDAYHYYGTGYAPTTYTSTSGTIAAWIWMADGDDGNENAINPVVADQYEGAARRIFCVNGGHIEFRDYGYGWGESNDYFTSTVAAFGDGDTSWHHIAVTWEDSVGVTFYLDGVQLGSTVGAGHTFFNNPSGLGFTYLAVGNDAFGGGTNGKWVGAFPGQIDDLYINYGEAKSQEFIQNLMPEPATVVLLGLGVCSLALRKRRQGVV